MISIVIESKSINSLEANFLKVIIEKFTLFPLQDIEFIPSNGWMNIKKIEEVLKDRQDSGNKILIVFDADNEINQGGYKKRLSELNNILRKIKINGKIFLFPNNKDEGTFEDLLEHLINKEHKVILKCFSNYEKCLKKYKINGQEKYQIPNQKAKIYAYISSFKMSKIQYEKMKNQADWQFDNPDYWNLNSDYLLTLKNFLIDNMK